FFQAEDGIRDRTVTGVQTCALPISFAAETGTALPQPRSPLFRRFADRFDAATYRADLERRGLRFVGRSDPGFPAALGAIFDPPRSEERRVGKECACGGGLGEHDERR